MTAKGQSQFSLSVLFALITGAACILWVVGQDDALIKLLLYAYLLAGYTELVLTTFSSAKSAIRSRQEKRRQNAEVFQKVGLVCRLPLFLMIVISAILRRIGVHQIVFETQEIWSSLGFIALVLVLPGFLSSLCSLFIYFRPIQNWPFAVVRILGISSALIVPLFGGDVSYHPETGAINWLQE